MRFFRALAFASIFVAYVAANAATVVYLMPGQWDWEDL